MTSNPGVPVMPGAGVPVAVPGVTGVTVRVPAGPSGRTVWPLRSMKTPHATRFLDPDYWAGYPNSRGVPTQPALKGYWHTGTDFNGPGVCNDDKGNPLFAVRDGVIEYAGPGGGSWGNILVIRVLVDGKPYWVRYGHVVWAGKGGTVAPKVGRRVACGDVVAYIGAGSWPCAHLHFDVFHTKPPLWGWWPLRNARPATVTALCTDPDAFLRALGAVQP